MEIKPDVCLYLFDLADVVRHEHVLITVDPNRVRIDECADLVYSASYPPVDRFEFCPVVKSLLEVVARIDKVVHVRSDESFVESQIRRDLLLSEENCIAKLFSKQSFGLLFLSWSHGVLSDDDTDPHKVVGL